MVGFRIYKQVKIPLEGILEFPTCPYMLISYWRSVMGCTVLTWTDGVTTLKCSVLRNQFCVSGCLDFHMKPRLMCFIWWYWQSYIKHLICLVFATELVNSECDCGSLTHWLTSSSYYWVSLSVRVMVRFQWLWMWLWASVTLSVTHSQWVWLTRSLTSDWLGDWVWVNQSITEWESLTDSVISEWVNHWTEVNDLKLKFNWVEVEWFSLTDWVILWVR